MSTSIFYENAANKVPFDINDRIFLGEGLFETVRIAKGRVIYPEEHWKRLNKAAQLLNLPFDLSLESWLVKLNYFVKLKNIKNGGMKVILSGTQAARGLGEQAKKTRLVFKAFEYTSLNKTIKLIKAPWHRDARNPIYQIKSINYLEAIMACRHAQSLGADDALFFNFQNHATDTTIANLFIIKNNRLFTPSIKSGVLAGIIRERLFELCRKQGVDILEKEFDADFLGQADAVFLTNVLQGIKVVSTYNEHQFQTNHVLIPILNNLLIDDDRRSL